MRCPCKPRHRLVAIATIVAVSLVGSGCHSWHSSLALRGPSQLCHFHLPADCSPKALVEESRKAQSRGAALEELDSEYCVDWYFSATRSAWMAAQLCAGNEALCGEAQDLYHDGLTALLRTAQKFERLDSRAGLTVRLGSRSMCVPVVHHGFAWQAGDFQRLSPPPAKQKSLLREWYCKQGCGVPHRRHTVPRSQFVQRCPPFSAAILLCRNGRAPVFCR